MSEERTGREIAIVGMAGRFPGAGDLGELWRNLRDGVEGIVRFSDQELREAGVEPAHLADATYVKAGGPLAGADLFDAGFFGYSAREAELLDPQHRLFLETVWQALEDSGHRPGGYGGLIGVYAGAAWNTYLLSNLTTRPELFGGVGAFQVFTASDKDFLPTRVSYKLDLRGPSVLVQTSCSTSLVATHLACLSLLNYECDLAIAGGVTVKVPQVAGYFHEEGGLASPDGRCRAFDAGAAGTVFGSGVGAVVLKRLEEALEDGDTIRAVILGSAINNDGALKVSYTAPSVEGQAEVIAAAQAIAGVDPATVQYVETHGTGTALGDPIEVAALAKVFGPGSEGREPCALGSVKSNLGHLDAAAGVAGLLKTVLALQHGEVPPSLHFERANPALELESRPFTVAAERLPWPRGTAPRRAGVSSFGVGGTNAHLVLEEAPETAPGDAARPGHLLVLSARSEAALDAACERLRDHLQERVGDDPEALADVAWTLQAGRTVFRHRRALACRDRDDAVALLSGAAPERVRTAVDEDDPRPRPIAFRFPGAAVDAEAVRTLAEGEPSFGETLDRYLGLAGASLDDPEAGPARLAVDLALTALWREWGVVPSAAHGRSALAAACAAGTLEPEEALRRAAGAGALPDPTPAEPDGDPDRVVLEIGPADRLGLLESLGTLWLAGVALDWRLVYRGERRRRVPLPTYPFERRRYWIEAAPRGAAGETHRVAGRRPDPADWLYLPSWRPTLQPPLVKARRRWLLLAPEGTLGDELSAALTSDGHEVTTVVPGAGFARRGAGRFEVDPVSLDGFRALLEALDEPPEVVVHAWTLESGSDAGGTSVAWFEAAQGTGFLGLLSLGRALEGAGTPEPLGSSLLVLSDGLDGPGAAPARPELAPLLGLLRVLPQELPGLRCRAVGVAAGRPGRELAAVLEREAADGSAAAAAAWRGAERWVEAFEGVRLPAAEEGGRDLGGEGSYLVTGGLIGVGRSIARLLARTPGARLVLLEDEAPGERGPRAEALGELEELAAAVDLHVAAPGDREAVNRAVVVAAAAPGGLRGVVHAAGPTDVASFRLVAEADPESCRRHFEPRVHRLLELDAALAAVVAGNGDGAPAFAWAVSSLASVLGGVGNAAYAASNRFLEAFASDRAARGGCPAWTAVAWDALRGDGDFGGGGDAGFAHRREDLAELALSPEECEEVARRLLALPAAGRLLVSTGDLGARLEAAERRARGRSEEGAEAATAPVERYPRPALPVAYAPPEGELEATVAEIWGQVLGFDRIGAHDNFFDLGGDSFLATRLAARLREELGIDLPVARLYEGTTVRALARILGDGAEGEAARRAQLLEERRESGERRKEVLERRRAARRQVGGAV